MPSVYNHENAFWGVRSSSCDMFQCGLNEEIQTNKIGECHPVQNYTTPNNSYVHYSVSSNGYYGYQPHKVIQDELKTNEIEMDVEETNVTTDTPQKNGNLNMFGCAAFRPDTGFQLHNIRRKRQMPNDYLESSKRTRQEETQNQMKSPTEESCVSHKEYYSHPKCMMAHFV